MDIGIAIFSNFDAEARQYLETREPQPRDITMHPSA